MDRTVVLIGNKKYKAHVNRVGKNIINIRLFSKRNEQGFLKRDSAFDKYIYQKTVSEKDITELYREYFLANYKNHDFFVIRDNKINKTIQIVTADSNIGRNCDLIQEDRDLFTKWLEVDDQYKLFHVKEYYLKNKNVNNEVTLDEYFNICNEEF